MGVTDSDLVPALVERFRGGNTETCKQVIEVVAAFGIRGISTLIELVAQSGNPDLCQHLITKVSHTGAKALREIQAVLERPGSPARALRGLLAALAQTKTLEASNIVRRFLEHPNASVREEALAALTRIAGRQAEPELLVALRDPAARVRRHALVCLGTVGSSNLQLMDFLCEVVRKRCEDEEEEDDQLQIRACQMMNEMGRIAASLGSRFETVLIEALDLDRSKEFLGRWCRSRGKSDAVRGAICTALGTIGGPIAAASLGRMLAERSLLVRDRVTRAIRQLEERLSPQTA